MNAELIEMLLAYIDKQTALSTIPYDNWLEPEQEYDNHKKLREQIISIAKEDQQNEKTSK